MMGAVTDKVDFPEIVGAGELLELLGVGRARMYQITTHKDFPPPIRELHAGKIWLLSDVEEWARARGRELYPLAPPATAAQE